MRKNFIVLTLCAMLFALCASVNAQQPEKIRRIGFLAVNSPSTDRHLDEAFKQSLRELGWIDGRNITIEYRSGEGKAGVVRNALDHPGLTGVRVAP